MILADLLTRAKKVNNYEADATTGTLWTSTTTYEVVCPADKRWFLIGGNINRAVSATLTIKGYDTADKPIYSLGQFAAATGVSSYPSQASAREHQQVGALFVFDAGEYILATAGTAQDANSYGSCVVLEIDV